MSKFIVIIFISSFASLINSSCSSPTSPPPPRNWFNIGIELDDHVAPKGIDFFVERDESSQCLEYYDSISVSNETSTPIYFEARSHWMESLDDYESCPVDNLCIKVVSDRTWEWDVVNYGDGPPWDFDWIMIETYDGFDKLNLWPMHEGLSPSGSSYYLDLFDNQNVEGYGGDRPDNVSVPESQFFLLPYVFESKNYDIGVTLSYTINECYPSESRYGGGSPTTQIIVCYVSAVIIGFAAFMFIVVSIINRIERMVSKREKGENPQEDI